jgi:cytoskeletal protein CcmA (bactofilin family)
MSQDQIEDAPVKGQEHDPFASFSGPANTAASPHVSLAADLSHERVHGAPVIAARPVKSWSSKDDGSLVVDHKLENIKHYIGAGSQLSGGAYEIHDGGGLLVAGKVIDAQITIPDGTLIVGEGAHVSGQINVRNLFNMGSVSGDICASGVLVSWGEAATLSGKGEYGALEVSGSLDGTWTKRKAA